ncbi:hypothetical protein TSACC_3402 [Terrimicrobium sacchariphilum]|uniref:Uncharacterized protein n=1 Tax=Terrimicrobium sacchariphilum TaxID=690879 RepID=A0A146GFD9_TERSA|nr:hypothetical protein TSACC_3402 [Terrimicrobium sacchariphilum]
MSYFVTPVPFARRKGRKTDQCIHYQYTARIIARVMSAKIHPVTKTFPLGESQLSLESPPCNVSR